MPTLIIGIGGAGGALASHLHSTIGGRIVSINTDRSALNGNSAPEKMLIGESALHGLGALSPIQARRAAEKSSQAIQQLFCGATQVILLAGLGGATGSGALPIIADLAKVAMKKTMIGATLPFAFEDPRRMVAESALTALHTSGHTIALHDHADSEKNLQSASFEQLSLLAINNINTKVIDWIQAQGLL